MARDTKVFMASKPTCSPSPSQWPAEQERRLCTGAHDESKASDRSRRRVLTHDILSGGGKVYKVDWTLSQPLPITRRELEVLEQYLRASIEEILHM